MLSLMRNPSAPPLICVSEEQAASAKRYRLYIVYRLAKLTFLDSAPVTAEERREGAAKVRTRERETETETETERERERVGLAPPESHMV